jgi:hypothetical protein
VVASDDVTRPIRGPWVMVAANNEVKGIQIKYDNRRTIVKKNLNEEHRFSFIIYLLFL